MTNYSIGDFLIQLKNASMARNKEIRFAKNKKVVAVAEALKKMGILDSVKTEKDTIIASLTFKNKRPYISNIKLISKPGLRIYMQVDEIEAKKGASSFLISTPKGVISSQEAIKSRVGGEVIAEVL